MDFFWGLRSKLRRYVSGLAGLLGPAAAFGGFGLAYGHPYTSLGLRAFGPVRSLFFLLESFFAAKEEMAIAFL
ncbi:hypothetical protein SapgrDRAFT_2914 [Saprospira grandis DSM 2844]|uniref:Uncharacterized protein n=1 Tax=Saprospira grandis DSM 2844 TaxID=694433 RepID=J1I6W8_9BACT|nr:hypothetical protein SapgrDRAFT_2914 [Saprospira grandis DSM 2844]